MILNFEGGAFALLVLLICAWLFTSKADENKLVKAVLSKAIMYLEGIYFMMWFSEMKGMGPKKNPDPDRIKGKPTTTKRLIFIRHGESDWNNVFNKGFGPSFPVRLFKAWYKELILYPTNDSGWCFKLYVFVPITFSIIS